MVKKTRSSGLDYSCTFCGITFCSVSSMTRGRQSTLLLASKEFWPCNWSPTTTGSPSLTSMIKRKLTSLLTWSKWTLTSDATLTWTGITEDYNSITNITPSPACPATIYAMFLKIYRSFLKSMVFITKSTTLALFYGTWYSTCTDALWPTETMFKTKRQRK